MLLENALIYTFDPRLPEADAILIRGGRVLAVGSAEALRSGLARGEEVVDLSGKTILPGLIDAHVHLSYFSRGLAKINCEVDSRQECLRLVQERARITPPGKWVLGHGWNQNVWPEGLGDTRDLDRMVPDRPVYLTDKSLHGGWANQAALQLAGITDTTPDPVGGVIQRDASGQPTGYLLEAANNLIEAVIPYPDPAQLGSLIKAAQPELWKFGITGVHDFDGTDCYQALQMLDEDGNLRLRVVKSIPAHKLESVIEAGLRTGTGSEYLRVGALKLFSDGGLGQQSAAMLEPYENSTSTGMLQMSEDEIFEKTCTASAAGIDSAVHAIGDKANRVVLNAFTRLRQYEEAHHLPRRRHRIEHVQLIHPEDAGRLAELGITASMQPVHATSDIPAADRHWGDRSKTGYAWKLLQDQGTRLAFGSDAPVESANPFWGIHAAVTRRRHDGTPGPEGWYPEQRIDLNSAIQGYTTGAAYASGQESRQGRLWTGCFADLAVLEQNPFQVAAQDMWQVKVSATMVGGEWVYQAG